MKMETALPKIVVLGAGLGGTISAYELRAKLKNCAEIMVVAESDDYWFVPSNPWVAVRWRDAEAIRIHLPPIFESRGIGFTSVGAKRLHPEEKSVELRDGSFINYNYLVIATGPDHAYDEIAGFGPDGHTNSICQTHHASMAADKFDAFLQNPGPIIIGAAQGASCYGPAYEFAMIVDTELRRRKLRDRVPMTFVTAEPYVGHLGLDGVGDTKGILESEMRNRHIKWITSARVTGVEAGLMHVDEIADGGAVSKSHDLPFAFAMMLPAFRGVPAIFGIEGLVNARGFVMVDEHQRNPAYPDIFALGVCVAIPPTGPTPVPVGVPKTGFMIESMATAITMNLDAIIDGRAPAARASWNAICLADFGDDGVCFIAQPQIPPRNVNWAAQGKWVHMAKIGFEKYFLRKIRKGESEPFYEKLALELIGVHKLKDLVK